MTHFGCTGQGTPRADRRGHDGLQGGAGRDRRRHGSRGRLAAQEGHLQGRQEGRPHRRRRPDRRRCRRCARRRSSRSIPRPTSSPATMPSRQIVRNVAKVALAYRRHDRSGCRRELSRLRQVGHRHDQGRGRHDRREPELPPLGQARGRAGRGRDLCPQRRRRRSRQARRAGGARDGRARPRLRTPSRRQVAMHVAATNPLALTRRGARPGRGRARARDLRRPGAPVRQAGGDHREDGRRPPAQVLRGSRALKQAFVLNPDLTVEKALKEAEKDIGAPAKITGFVRFALGEGIEKEDHRLRGRSRGGGQKVALDQALLRSIRARAPRDIAAPFVYRAPNCSTGRRPGRHGPMRAGRASRGSNAGQATLSPCPAEGVRRGADGRPGLRHRRVGRRPIAADIAEARELGVEVGVVIGGGNIFRGVAVASKGGDRVTGDHMGMLGTVINSLALRTSLVKLGVDAVVLSAIAMPELCESFSQRQATAYMNAGRVVHLRRRHRQSVLHHRFRRGAAGRRDRRRRAVQGHPGRRRLFGRSQEGPARRPATTASRHDDVLTRGLADHGRRRDCACARKQHSDNRLFDPRERRFRRHSEGRRPLHDRGGRLKLLSRQPGRSSAGRRRDDDERR